MTEPARNTGMCVCVFGRSQECPPTPHRSRESLYSDGVGRVHPGKNRQNLHYRTTTNYILRLDSSSRSDLGKINLSHSRGWS